MRALVDFVLVKCVVVKRESDQARSDLYAFFEVLLSQAKKQGQHADLAGLALNANPIGPRTV